MPHLGRTEIEKKKLHKCNELAFVMGTVLCALGVAMTIKAGFGLSMIAAPPYIIHHWVAHYLPWTTHGMSEAVWQLFVLCVLVAAVRKFNHKYLMCFIVAIISSALLDFWLLIFGGHEVFTFMPVRIICFAFGIIITSFAIACLFRTTLPLQIHELIVVEIASNFHLDEERVKFANDIILLLISVTLALLLNHSLEGIGVGTVLATIFNAPLINFFGKFLDKYLEFDSAFPKITHKLSI